MSAVLISETVFVFSLGQCVGGTVVGHKHEREYFYRICNFYDMDQNGRDRQTDGRTDGRTAALHNTVPYMGLHNSAQ